MHNSLEFRECAVVLDVREPDGVVITITVRHSVERTIYAKGVV